MLPSVTSAQTCIVCFSAATLTPYFLTALVQPVRAEQVRVATTGQVKPVLQQDNPFGQMSYLGKVSRFHTPQWPIIVDLIISKIYFVPFMTQRDIFSDSFFRAAVVSD